MSDYLQQFESFDESEDKSLYINYNSDLYLISYNNKRFVAWEKVNFATTIKYKNENYLETQKSFYNVVDGSLVLNTYELFDLDKNKTEIFKPNNISLFPLGERLNLNKAESTVLGRDKVLKLVRNSQ